MDLDRRASLLLPLSLLGCSPTRNAKAASAEFIDCYYVERDHERALRVSADGAAERVRTERELLQGSTGVGAQPRVYYKLAAQQEKGGETELAYVLTLDTGGEQLKKQVRVRVRKIGEEHRVVFFTEQDLPPTK